MVFGQNKAVKSFWHERNLVKNPVFQLIDV